MIASVYWVEGSWPGRVAILARPRGGDWLADEVRSWVRSGLGVVVSLLTPVEAAEFELLDEAALCASNGIEFVSFPVVDRGVPASPGEMAHLVKALQGQLASGRSVGIHCRQGIGRSGLVAACLLAASGTPPAAAFDRISEARGRPVPETPEQREWVEAFWRQRAA